MILLKKQWADRELDCFSSSYHLVLQHAKLPTNTTAGLPRSWKMIGTLPGAVSSFFSPVYIFIQRFFAQKRFLHIPPINISTRDFTQKLFLHIFSPIYFHPGAFLPHTFHRYTFHILYWMKGWVPPLYRTKTGAPIPFLSRTSLKWKCTSIKQENYLKKQIFTATNLLQNHF